MKDGKRHAYWALVESYRTERGPRQRVVAYLGKLDEAGRVGLKQAAAEKPSSTQKKLFAEPEPEWVEVDATSVEVRCLRTWPPRPAPLSVIESKGLWKRKWTF